MKNFRSTDLTILIEIYSFDFFHFFNQNFSFTNPDFSLSYKCQLQVSASISLVSVASFLNLTFRTLSGSFENQIILFLLLNFVFGV